MDAIDIGLIIIGILATIIMLIGAFFGIAMIIAAPILGKLIGMVITMAMVIIIVGLWMLILS
jgi:hypothetical protein